MRSRLRRPRANPPRHAVPLHPRVRGNPSPACPLGRSISPCRFAPGKKTDSELPKFGNSVRGLVPSKRSLGFFLIRKDVRVEPLHAADVINLGQRCPGAVGLEQLRLVLEQEPGRRFVLARGNGSPLRQRLIILVVGYAQHASHTMPDRWSILNTLPMPNSYPFFPYRPPNLATKSKPNDAARPISEQLLNCM